MNTLCALESKNMDLRNFVKQLPEVRRKNVELKSAAAELEALVKDNKRLQSQIDSKDAVCQQNIKLKKRLKMYDAKRIPLLVHTTSVIAHGINQTCIWGENEGG